MDDRESDQLIVLGGGRADHMGKELTVIRSLQRKHMLNSRVREHVHTSLQGIATKAKEDKEYRFCDVYRLINRISLMDAWYDLNKRAASGIDGVTAREYEKGLIDNIVGLEGRLKEKRYKAKGVKRVYIPKPNGKKRPLGMPCLEDKLVQQAAARILNAIFEQDFLPFSYGYRPKRGALDGIKELTRELSFGRYSYIVEVDIKGFFDNIDHEWLIRMLEQRINDRAFIGLIRKWLSAGILEEGIETISERGTPQGGIVSPILANIYLHYAIDLWMERVVKRRCEGQAYIVRYADDFVCAFQFRREAERFHAELEARLGKFGLETAKEKTRIISFSRFRKEEKTYFTFLGFEFRWGTDRNGKDRIKRRTSGKKMQASIKGFTVWIKEFRNKRLRRIFGVLNSKLRGYYNYFGVIGNFRSLKSYFDQVRRLLYKWLNRRSQRRSFNYRGFVEILDYFKIERPRITQVALPASS
jgi:RNA-directed DNA polymerase